MNVLGMFNVFNYLHLLYYSARRKPGPKSHRVTPSPLPPPGPAPSASLAQLFAAADSPRPNGGDETDPTTHHKVIILLSSPQRRN